MGPLNNAHCETVKACRFLPAATGIPSAGDMSQHMTSGGAGHLLGVFPVWPTGIYILRKCREQAP